VNFEISDLKSIIEGAYRAEAPPASGFSEIFEAFLTLLESGDIRAAEPTSQGWKACSWVKEGILLGFRFGVLQVFSAGPFSFVDKDTFPPRRFDSGQGVRVVPGGTAVRRGAHVQEGVVIMPPAYLNVGCYVGSGTMVDSHALVGSCAQIGQRVHLSAGTQIGGVLEPVGAVPVVVEDDVFVGGNCGIYEGTVVARGAVLGAGTILTRSVPVYDTVRNRVLRGSADQPLAIPEGAVVVPGTRPAAGEWAESRGLSLSCAVIIKYRDEKTSAGTTLEEDLR
jgi:2,3,4,5-tetrahydropyridine-2,6-dicarboxylate N-succinyltransferase